MFCQQNSKNYFSSSLLHSAHFQHYIIPSKLHGVEGKGKEMFFRFNSVYVKFYLNHHLKPILHLFSSELEPKLEYLQNIVMIAS